MKGVTQPHRRVLVKIKGGFSQNACRCSKCRRRAWLLKGIKSNGHILKVFTERWLLSWGLKEGAGCPLGVRGIAAVRTTQAAEAWPGGSSVWDLPLRFYFVGFWLGVHRVRDPHCVQCPGLCGRFNKGSIRANSLLSRQQEEALAVGQPPRACPPRAPGRQRGQGRRWG